MEFQKIFLNTFSIITWKVIPSTKSKILWSNHKANYMKQQKEVTEENSLLLYLVIYCTGQWPDGILASGLASIQFVSKTFIKSEPAQEQL